MPRINSDERDLKIYEAAWLHYQCGRSQKEIAAAMGVDKATVSRYLADAAQRGVVSVTLNPPSNEHLEIQLRQTFKLDHVKVIPRIPEEKAEVCPEKGKSDSETAALLQWLQCKEIGTAAAEFIARRLLVENAGLGLGGGRSVAAFAQALPRSRHCPTGIRVYGLNSSNRDPFEICATSVTAVLATGLTFGRFQAKTDGSASPMRAECDALRLPSSGGDESTTMKTAAEQYYDQVMHKIDVVVTGIGAIESCWFLSEEESKKLKARHVVGDILYDLYGKHGRPIRAKTAATVYSFGIDRLRTMIHHRKDDGKDVGKEVIVISFNKNQAIYHALSSAPPFVTGIVTDEPTARAVLKLHEQSQAT